MVFSMLSALEQRGAAGDIKVERRTWKWNDVGIHNSHIVSRDAMIAHFSKAIASLPQGGAAKIWKDMVFRYRNKLLHHVREDRISVEHDGLETAYQLACAGSEADRQALVKACITIRGALGSGWSRDMLLQSLFADELVDKQDAWPAGKLKSLQKFLQSLKNEGMSETKEYWVGEIDKVMTLVRDKQKTVLNGIRPKRKKTRIGTMAIICWWLERKGQQQLVGKMVPFNTTVLPEDFGYNAAHRGPLTGCLKILGLSNHTRERLARASCLTRSHRSFR